MYRYAQIDIDTGLVVSNSYLSGIVYAENMIPIEEDFDLTNKKYVDGEWVEYTPEPVPEPEPSQLDRIEAAVSKSQQDIIDAYTLELVEGGII